MRPYRSHACANINTWRGNFCRYRAVHSRQAQGLPRPRELVIVSAMIDKIGYTRPNTPAARAAAARKSSAAGGAAFADALSQAGSSSASSSIDAPASVAVTSGIGVLLGAQEVTEEEINRRKSLKRGRLTLEALENLRDALLTGRLPITSLRQLEELVRDERILTADPRLNDVLDDIEVRAAVELAKLEMSGVRL